MTSTTTTPRHAIESDAPGSFQPFTDLRTHTHGAVVDTAAIGAILRASGAGHVHPVFDADNTHAPYVGSLEEPGHFHDVMPASLSGLVGSRFPDASNDPQALSAEVFTEIEFVEAMESKRAAWNALIDTMLDAQAPGWREERARQQAAAA